MGGAKRHPCNTGGETPCTVNKLSAGTPDPLASRNSGVISRRAGLPSRTARRQDSRAHWT